MLQNRLFELEDQFEESTGEKLEQQIRLRHIRSIQQNLAKFLSVCAAINGLWFNSNSVPFCYCLQSTHSTVSVVV